MDVHAWFNAAAGVETSHSNSRACQSCVSQSECDFALNTLFVIAAASSPTREAVFAVDALGRFHRAHLLPPSLSYQCDPTFLDTNGLYVTCATDEVTASRTVPEREDRVATFDAGRSRLADAAQSHAIDILSIERWKVSKDSAPLIQSLTYSRTGHLLRVARHSVQTPVAVLSALDFNPVASVTQTTNGDMIFGLLASATRCLVAIKVSASGESLWSYESHDYCSLFFIGGVSAVGTKRLLREAMHSGTSQLSWVRKAT